MADIGEEKKEVTFEPVPAEVPVEEPREVPAEAPEKEKEPVSV